MPEPDYAATVQRILDLLRDNGDFAAKIAEFRFGELPEEHEVENTPACYVTTSTNPEVSRTTVASSEFNRLPRQKITSEYWVVLVGQAATPAGVQKRLYELRNMVIDILAANVQLRRARGLAAPDTVDTDTPDTDLIDRQCDTLTINSIRRLTRQRGRNVDGLTVIVQTVNYKD